VRAIRRAGVGYPAAALLVAGTIGLLKLFRGLNESSVALLLLLAVFLAAWVWQSGPGVLAALLATAGFNFFFLPPLYTFTIQDPRNVAALFVFLASGLLIGRLSALSRQRLGQVEAERRDLATLTRLSQAFMADTNRESLLGVVVDRLRDALQCQQVSLWLARDGAEIAEVVATPGASARQDLVELAYRQGNSAEFPSDLGGNDIYLPVPVGVQRAGVLIARGVQSSERLAEGCSVLLGLALERERFLRLARTAEETKASEQMKSTLLAALAHDLKTPVATARGAVENWMAEVGGSEKSGLALDQMKALSRRIEELMEVVRLDSGIARPRREVVSAGELVEAAISRFGEALENHSLFIEPPPPDAAVEVDPGQLTEALGHGLENAAAYSPRGSAIRVAATVKGSSVFFRIADQGSGVPATERERVFERFVRLPSSEAVPGTGLGLSISRSLVELNGGRLRLSDGEGGGTTFEIELPKVSR
jgi:two-component system, OmpR family, sensor histidine kinase KdpD